MFFVLLCLLVAILLGTGNSPDRFGWMMLLGVGWLAGYLDCRLFAKSDREQDRVMPPDMNEPLDTDLNSFQV